MAGRRGASLPSCFILMVAVLLVAARAGRSHAGRPEPAAERESVEFIRSACGATRYPRLCFETLSAYAGAIRTSPMQLAQAALSVSLDGARSTSAAVAKILASVPAGTRPRVGAAVRDCVENMAVSVEEMQKSVEEMGRVGAMRRRGDVAFQISNIQTWVSAALTNEDTCMDGFAGRDMAGSLKSAVREKIVAVARLTSNALALVNALV